MIARRRLLQLGTAMLVAGPARARARAEEILLYDARLASARVLAARMPGVRSIDTGRDLPSLWYRGLREQALRRRIVGITGYADMAVMRGLAAEQRRRMRARQLRSSLWHWTIEA